MEVTLATEADSAQLLEFFSEQPFLTGPPVDLVVHRTGSFFDKYKLQSDDFDTFIMKDRHQKVIGTATILYRQVRINNTVTTVGYGTDLRIANNRNAIVAWPELIFPKFEESLRKHNCTLTFTAINFSQGAALNALIRPRSQRRNIPRYYLLRNFDMVTIHGRSPFLQGNPLNTVKIFDGESYDLEPLVNYLNKKSKNLMLSTPYTVDLMLDRFKRWKGLSIEKFLIAKDVRGNIVGCCAPWNMSHVQTIDVTNYSGVGSSFRTFMGTVSWTGFVKNMPGVGGALNLSHLTHLYADNPDIFRRMLKTAFRNTTGSEILTYVNFARDTLKLPPRVFITSTLPFALYTVLPSEISLPGYLQPSTFTPPPELESVLI